MLLRVQHKLLKDNVFPTTTPASPLQQQQQQAETPQSRALLQSSSLSMGDSGRSQGRSIHEKLVRERSKKSDLHDYYEIVEQIGQGGMCKIYKIRKRRDKVGGSSRANNIVPPKSLLGKVRGARRRRVRMSSSPSLLQQFSQPTTSTSSSALLKSIPTVKDSAKDDTALTGIRTGSHHHRHSQSDRGRVMAHAVSEPALSPWRRKRPVVEKIPGGDTKSIPPLTLESTDTTSWRRKPQDHPPPLDDDTELPTDIPPAITAFGSENIDASPEIGSSCHSTHSVPMIPSGESLVEEDHTITRRDVTNDSSDDDIAAFFGRKPASHLYFALKEINLAMVKEDKINQLKNEVEILKALDHKNIIKAYETFFSKQSKKLMIVMELCTGGDLYSRLPYQEESAARIVRQMLSAVSYIHERNIVHRDLKMENVMFENDHPDSIIKLIDFGLSKQYTQKDNILSERVGTLYSMSPETMMGVYNTKADMWSMGVCTYMMLANGAQPFTGKTPKQIVAKVLVGRYSFEKPHWSSISEEARDFIRALLVVKPEKRLSANDAKQHAWLQKVSEHPTPAGGTTEVDEEFKDRVRECIVRYAQSGEFLKLALNVIAKNSSAEDIFKLRAVFDEFDTDDTGTLTLNEFKEALGQLDYSENDIEEIFRSIDVNKSNEINYTEFLAAALETQGRIQEYRLAEAFDILDCDDRGYISRKNLRAIVGENAGEDYIDQLMSEADFCQDGRISYAEFLHAFNKRNHELVNNLYELECQDSDHSYSDEEVLRRFGIVKTIQRAFGSNEALKEMGHVGEKTRANGTSNKLSKMGRDRIAETTLDKDA